MVINLSIMDRNKNSTLSLYPLHDWGCSMSGDKLLGALFHIAIATHAMSCYEMLFNGMLLHLSTFYPAKFCYPRTFFKDVFLVRSNSLFEIRNIAQ